MHVMAIFGDFKFSKKIYGVQRKLRGAPFFIFIIFLMGFLIMEFFIDILIID